MQDKAIIRLAFAIEYLAESLSFGLMLIALCVTEDSFIQFIILLLFVLGFVLSFFRTLNKDKEQRHYGIYDPNDPNEDKEQNEK